MLARLIHSFLERFIHQLPVPALRLAPIATVSHTSSGLSLQDILDGFLLATPKRRTPLHKKWRKRYGSDNWKYGIKMFQPKRNIISCMECGSFHEYHTVCRECFKKVHEESKSIIESIRKKWGKGVIDKEVKVLYQGEEASVEQNKQVVEIDRTRPLWFSHNLSQKSAYPRNQIEGPAKESIDRTVRVKNEQQ